MYDDIFTRENNMVFSEVKRWLLLWLHNPLKLYLHVFLYDQNISSSLDVFGYLRKSLAIFGNFQKMFGNDCLAFGRYFWRIFGNLLKTVKQVVIGMFINKQNNTGCL